MGYECSEAACNSSINQKTGEAASKMNSTEFREYLYNVYRSNHDNII